MRQQRFNPATAAALLLLLVASITAQEPSLDHGQWLTVEYEKSDAIAKAVKSAAFDSAKFAIPLPNIPYGGSGKVTHEVYELDFGRLVFDKDLPAELDKRGFVFADPLTALTYAAKFPNRQRLHPINILFTDTEGQPCYLLLGGDSTSRLLGTMTAKIGHWGPGARFLVVRKTQQTSISPQTKFVRHKKRIPNRYIVVLYDDVVSNDAPLEVRRARIAEIAKRHAEKYGGKVDYIYETALKGYAIELPNEAAAIAISKLPEVKLVEEDSMLELAQASDASRLM